jgi:type II secretory pathway pseudopilin PulG
MSEKKHNKKFFSKTFLFSGGFSFHELLIVLSIIVVLAVAVLLNVKTLKDKAKAARLLSDFQNIEKALGAWGIDEKVVAWWDEDVWGAPTDEPTITWLIENTNLGNWLKGTPAIDGNLYVYDNDLDSFDTNGDGCADGSIEQGVFINIWSQALIDAAVVADKQLDNGDGASCGRVVWDAGGGSGYFIGYKIGNNSTFTSF